MHQNLPFTVWNLLKTFDPERKGFVSKSRFFKLSYIVHMKLKKRGIQTGLPWCWYIYGPEVQMNYLPSQIFTTENRPDGLRIFHGTEPRGMPPLPKDRTPIIFEITSLQKRSPRTDELIREIYANPPKKVLSLLKEYDELLDSIKKGQDMVLEDKAPYILLKLDKIENSYSEEDFEEMYSEFLRIDDMMRLLINRRSTDIGELSGTIHQFREIVATKASILFNENLPGEFISERTELLKTRIETFRPLLEALESRLLKDVRIEEKDKKHIGELAKAASIIARGD